MPAAVVMATVAEPVARRISAASSHASNSSGTWLCSATTMIAWETPLSCRMRPKPPPAPTRSVMVAVGARHSLLKRRIVSRDEAAHLAKRDKAEQHTDQQRHVVIADQVQALIQRASGRGHSVRPAPDQHQKDGQQDGEQREPEAGQAAFCAVIDELRGHRILWRQVAICGAISFA